MIYLQAWNCIKKKELTEINQSAPIVLQLNSVDMEKNFKPNLKIAEHRRLELLMTEPKSVVLTITPVLNSFVMQMYNLYLNMQNISEIFFKKKTSCLRNP